MAQYDIDLREYWRVIRRRKVIVILTTILLALFSIALAIIRAPSPLYEATCSVKFEKSVSPLGLYTMIISIGPGDVMQTQMGVIKSHSVFKKVALNMGLIDKTEDSDPRVGRIISDLQSKVQVSRQGNSNIIDITTTANRPAFAADLANQVALAYKETHAHEINRRIAQTIKFIKEQLEILDGRLRKSEEKLRRFREDKNLIVLSSQSSNLLSRADSLETRLSLTMEARKELKDVMERINEASSKPLDLKGSFSSEKASALYIKLNSRLIDLMLERDTLLVQYTSSHPQVIEIDNQIIEITRKMLTELKSHLKIQEEKEKWLREEIDIVKEKIQSLPTEGLELSRLESDVDRTDKIYSLLETKHQEALIQDAEKPEEVSIVRPALEPSRRINSPRIFSSGLLGAMIGLVLGLVFAFIVETFDTSLGAIDEVEESLGLQVLGLIPHIELKEIQATLKDKDNKGILHDPVARNACLISRFGSQSVLAESFRSLRTSIQFGALEKNIKSIVLTSATPQEGKSIVAANLAIVMAQGGLKTIILGADLRKPTIYRIFGLDASPGLTDLLLGNYDFSETVRTVTDIMMGKMSMDEIMLTPGIDNLHIMTGGTIPSNPAELMHSEKFKGLVDEIHDKYDVILIDTPPLISAADASILAMLSDGVLLVYRAGMVARGVLKRVKTQLEQVKANIIGVVLNGVRAEISPDYEDLKRHKYYYYYGKEEKKDREKTEKRGGRFLRRFFLVSALFFLIFGLLWQNGIINLDNYIHKDKQPVKEDKVPLPPVKEIKPIKIDRPKANITPPPPSTDYPNSLQKDKQPVKEAEIPLSPPEDIKPIKIDKPRANITPSPHTTSITYPYSLQIGSFKSPRRASEVISFLKGKGLSPYWDLVDLGEKGKRFRVFVGHFEGLEEARRFKEGSGLKASKIVKMAYTNEVGYFASKEDMKEKLISIGKAGYSPYIIEDPQKGYRLLIGAFSTKEDARKLARSLKEAGIETKVVLR